jgi:hypothetical protein
MDMNKIEAVYRKQYDAKVAELAEAKKAVKESRDLLASARTLYDRHARQVEALGLEVKALESDIRREFGS